jgi:hypothetical protein
MHRNECYCKCMDAFTEAVQIGAKDMDQSIIKEIGERKVKK